MTTNKLLLASVVLVTAMSGCSNNDNDNDNASGSTSAPRLQVVFDYSPTLSDVGALLYLATNPAVELLAVTLPGTGEADCEPGVLTTRALLKEVGHDEIPVGCGRNTPLIGNRDWPDEWRASANALGSDFLPTVEPEPLIDAEQLIADTLRAATTPITLVAVGPLTNLGVVLSEQPDLAEQVERVVIMGGAVTVPGNVDASPAAEWNIYVDPEAARRVIASGVAVTLVPLDATNYVAWNDRLVTRIGALETPAAGVIHKLANSLSLDGFFLWDELAAMVAVVPTLATLEQMRVRVDDDGAVVQDQDGVDIDVAISADTSTAMDEFVKGLNGGTAPPVVSLTAAELAYFVELGGADSRLGMMIGHAFQGVDETNPDLRGMAASLFSDFIAAVDGFLVEVREINPPSSLDEAHSELVEAFTEFVGNRDNVLEAVAAADGADMNELINNAFVSAGIDDMFGRINAACDALVEYSFLRNGPRPCSAGS